ncbi:arsenosugar biosynthesis radical SAM protein ArsS [Candidatus Desantisbacteria bacterium]|nr:arsenosugar biosynthesis radical SAM protein ArsS [Candidatus Desantisbacteria bacterium]
MNCNFKETIKDINSDYIRFTNLKTLQVNLGNTCNQRCRHCHVYAEPGGSNIMSVNVMEKIILFLEKHPGIILDVTGGCPELNPGFRLFIEYAERVCTEIMVRTNLTVFYENGMERLPEWYREKRITLIASLPCYTEKNVNKQRGNGVFEKSIKALKKLNSLGYGKDLPLDIMYNPAGEFLPAPQKKLEKDFKKNLFKKYGIIFNKLLTLTNAPLGRFKNYLILNGKMEQYIRLLASNFNSRIVPHIMCRSLINIDWQGILYNCDFNQAAGLPIRDKIGKIMEVENMDDFIYNKNEIITAEHCYSCTAGEGSSCIGALI